MTPARILIIAGSDSGGGAGIQADIKVVTMMGGHAMTAITAITAQNSLKVEAVMPVPAEMVLKQIDAVARDIGMDAVKIGMIGSAEIANALADRLAQLSLPIVFDPVMVASSGSVLADAGTIAAFERLMTIATLVTPNLPELAALTGRSVTDAIAMGVAAKALAARTGAAVLAKGGHLDGPPVDLLVPTDGQSLHWEGERIETRNSHGTGCTLASAIACGLGQGLMLADSISRARAYVVAALRAAPGFGAAHGPIGHTLGMLPFALTVRSDPALPDL